MLARIVGIGMLLGGAILGFKSILPLVGGVLGFIGMGLVIAAIGLALYLGWRLINSRSAVGKIVGAIILVLGIVSAFPASLALVAGTVAAVLLMARLALVVLLLYFGWLWFQRGEFSRSRRSGI